MGDALKDFSTSVDRLEDDAMERVKDLEEQISVTVQKMTKEIEREQRLSMTRVKELVTDFTQVMYDAEGKILRHARAVSERTAPERPSPVKRSHVNKVGRSQ
eukprot:4558602-Karenia_brevis.AAC.1